MRRFRFRPRALLEWRRKQLEAAEEELRALEVRRRAALDRAASREAESAKTLERLASGDGLTGRDLRDADAWRDNLALEAMAAAEEAARLEAQAVDLRLKLVRRSRDVELLERLRKRRLREHVRDRDKRLEQLSTEIFLAASRKPR